MERWVKIIFRYRGGSGIRDGTLTAAPPPPKAPTPPTPLLGLIKGTLRSAGRPRDVRGMCAASKKYSATTSEIHWSDRSQLIGFASCSEMRKKPRAEFATLNGIHPRSHPPSPTPDQPLCPGNLCIPTNRDGARSMHR
jgi:hypothetical protein